MKHSFFAKVSLVIVGLLSLTLLLTSLAAIVAIDRNVNTRVLRELETGSRVFHQILDSRSELLIGKVEVLAEDFAFRRALATGDRATAESALINHGDRAGAGAVMWIDRDGIMRISTHHDTSRTPDFPFPWLLEDKSGEGTSAVVRLPDGLYQVVLVSVRAPQHIGWILMGFPIDDTLALQQRELTQMDVSWISSSKDGGVQLLSSTLPAADRAQLNRLAAAELLSLSGAQELNLDKRYMVRIQRLGADKNTQAMALLQVSLEDAYAQFRKLQFQLALIAALALLLSAIGALVLARSVSKPLRALKDASQRISSGNYSVPVDVRTGDEMEILATTFNEMQLDIAEREQRIVYQSQHDLLTGLPNRSVMSDRLETAIARARREKKCAALMAINIRRFKEINDTMGQQAGDEVLRNTADRLRQQLRETDTILRLGSDDFLTILEAGDEADLRNVMSNLLIKLSQHMDISKLQIRVNYMAGGALFPMHGEKAPELLRRTDIALNTARENQEQLHFYQLGEDEQHLRRVQIIADLPDAINNSKMFMVYQPKVAMSDRKASHVEALVRWIHPELGFISPEEFVLLAEQSGNVKLLTHFVIRTVVAQLNAWQGASIDANIAINLSALDLLDPSLPDVVSAYLNTYKVAPERLTFEITESALMQEPELAIRVLNMLKGKRIRLSIDDFGTGYSSLSQLKRLPVDELKIDKSFILELEADTDDAQIVRSTIELGHNLGLKVIAEGVESEESWQLLDSFGCDYVQGYLISKPIKADEFLQWWNEFNAR